MSYLPDQTPASKTDLEMARAELKADIGDVRAELKADIAEVRDELRATRTELKDEIKDLRTDIRLLGERVNGFYDALHAQTRVHVAASMGSAVTVAGLVFIAAQLV